MANAMIQSRADFAEDLWLYGEDELAVAMLGTDDATYQAVMVAAGSPDILEQDTRQSWSVQEMGALGAVQVLTGHARYCVRRRRRPTASVTELWARVGRAPSERERDEILPPFPLPQPGSMP